MGAQLLPVFAQVVDRVLLTGMLVQRLGVQPFERWSLIMATVSTLTILDLGAQMTFFNRMALASGAGDTRLAGRIYRESNSIFAALAILVAVATALFSFVDPVQHFFGFDPVLSSTERWVAMLIGGSAAGKMAVSNSNGAYRASSDYAKGTLIFSLVELVRSALVVGAVVVEPGLLAPAAVTFIATAVPYNLYIPYDLGRRFPLFAFRLAWPTSVTTHRAFRDSLLYASTYFPSIVLTQIPVMIIGGRAATGILAGFVLMRTLTNMLRTVVVRFTNVIGMELGRLETQNRVAEMAMLYTRACHFAAYLFGFTSGLLLSWGDEVVVIWTGSARFYDPVMLALMLAPLALTPSSQIAGPFMTFSHRPARLALAFGLQTALAAVLAMILPISNIALRFTVAIYGAELICLPPLLLPVAARLFKSPVVSPALRDLARAAVMAATTWALATFLRGYWGGIQGLLGATILLGALAAPLFYIAVKPLTERARS